MPTYTPGTQEYKDYYNAISLPGDSPPQQQDDDRSDDGNGHGGIRAPMSDRDEYYSQQPNVPPNDVDKPYDKSEHEPKTEKGRAADARLRSDMQKAGAAQQQRALDEKRATIQETKLLSQIVPGEVVGRWSVQTENGRKWFMAVSEDQALRQARTAGLHPTSARLTSVHTYTEEELAAAYAKIGKCGGRASRRDEFERAIKMGLIPEDAEFETIGDREWGYRIRGSAHVYKGSQKEWVYQSKETRAALAALEPYKAGDNSYYLDQAIRGGITDDQFRAAGFNMDLIGQWRVLVRWADTAPTEAEVQARKTRRNPFVSPFIGLKGKGKTGPQLTAEFNPEKAQPVSNTAAAATVRNTVLRPFRNEGGSYDLPSMVETRAITPSIIRSGGFTDEQITAAIVAAMQKDSRAKHTAPFAATTAKGQTGQLIPQPIDPQAARPTTSAMDALPLRVMLLPYRNKDGTYRLVDAIDSDNIMPSTLTAAGFTQAQVENAVVAAMKKALAAAQFTGVAARGQTGVTLPRAFDPDAAKPSGRTGNTLVARALLLPYRNRDGSYRLVDAIESDKVMLSTLVKAGFTQAQVEYAAVAAMKKNLSVDALGKTAALGSTGPQIAGKVDPGAAQPVSKSPEAAAIRETLMVAFRNDDGSYDLTAMVESGYVPASFMRDAGFSDTQITAAMREHMMKNDPDREQLLAACCGSSSSQDERIKSMAVIMDIANTKVGTEVREAMRRQHEALLTDAARSFLNNYRDRMVARVKTDCVGGACTIEPDDDDVRLSGGGSCSRTQYEALPAGMQKELDKLGIDAFEEKYLGTGQTTRDVIVDTGLSMLPIYGTYHVYKSGAPTWEVALSAGLDLLWIVPPVRVAAGVARTGTKLGVKGFAKAAKTIAIAELRAPVDLVVHPKQTLKVLLDPVETALRSSKVPLESVTVSYHTIKVPSVETRLAGLTGKSVWTPQEAMRARDELMRLSMQKGAKPVVTEAGQTVKLEQALLQKVGPVAVSGTEDIRPFLNGAVIGAGDGKELYVGPNLYERFTVATSGGAVTPGGVRGALIIRDEEILDALRSSGKLYKGSAEGEKVLQAGIKLPPPSQTLFTRDLAGERITLLVFGKPYTEAEIEGFKLLAPQETVRQIFGKRVAVSAAEKPVNRLAAIDAKLAQAEARAARYSGSSIQGRLARREVQKLTAQRADLVADIERRAASTIRYAAVDTSGGRAFAAVRRMVETATDLQQAARAEARRETRTPTRAPVRATLGREERLSETRRSPLPPERRAVSGTERRAPAEPDRAPVTLTEYTPQHEPTRSIPRIVPTPRGEAETDIPGPRRRKLDVTGALDKRPRDDTGRVQWKQGKFWVMVEPPPTEGERQRNVYYSRRPFWGVRVVKGTPERTFAYQGNPPKWFKYDMGITHADIYARERPHLRYRQTRAGRRRRGRVI